MNTSTVGGVATSYLYDADGLRTRKVAQTKTSFYLHGPGNEILSELERTSDPTLLPVRDYVYAGSRLIASVRPPVPVR